MQIVSPEPGSYLSGPTQLKAGVEPAASVTAVAFFVDGRQVCEVAQPPFECEWDAGRDVAAHQVRLVVTPLTGQRIVRTLRTKALRFADKVDVDAVQVTVTVTDDDGRFVAGLPRSAFRSSRTASRRRSATSRPRTCRSS